LGDGGCARWWWNRIDTNVKLEGGPPASEEGGTSVAMGSPIGCSFPQQTESPKAAPNSQRDKISIVHCHELKRARLGFGLSLLCLELRASDSHVEEPSPRFLRKQRLRNSGSRRLVRWTGGGAGSSRLWGPVVHWPVMQSVGLTILVLFAESEV
jgi:hypothetical protein